MNWRFWTHPRPDEICAQIAPLLSLESDGMASPAETARIAAHLQTCDACRQARMWMQATRQVIVQRPAVVPPSALRARIVQAMAQTAPAPVRPAPRPLILRPAFAAACSLTLVGAVALRLLWPGQTPPVVAPVPPRIARTAPAPPISVKRAAPSVARIARVIPPAALLPTASARPPRSLIAEARTPRSLIAQTQTIEKRSPVSSVPAPVPPKRNPRVILARSGDNASAAAPLPVRKTTIPEPTRVAVQPPTARTPLVETPAPPVEPTPAAPEPDKPTVVASAPPPVIARPDTNSALRSGLLNRQGEARAVRTVHASASTGSLSRTASYDPDRESRSGTLSAVNSDQVQQR